MDKAQEQANNINEQQKYDDAMIGWGINNGEQMETCHKNFGTGYFLIQEEHLSETSVYIDKQKKLKLYIKYINDDVLNELYVTKGYQTIGKGLVIDMKNNTTIGKYIISYGPCSNVSRFYEVSTKDRMIEGDRYIDLANPNDLANAISIDLKAKFEQE